MTTITENEANMEADRESARNFSRDYAELLDHFLPAGKNQLHQAAFLLKRGLDFQFVRRLPKDVARGESGKCFRTALLVAQAKPRKYFYCEGYATGLTDSGRVLIPTEHAWICDRRGRAFDPTWTNGRDYFGVAFDLRYALRVAERSGTYGILWNFNDGFKCLTGEDPPRFAKLRAA